MKIDLRGTPRMDVQQLRCELVPISDLIFDPANERKHGEKNLDAIKGSLVRFGQQKPVVIDKDNVVIAGNGTLAAAKALGWTEVNVVRSDLQGVDRAGFRIADNRTAELAEWDTEALNETLKALDLEGFDLESIGFDFTLDETPEPQCDEDEVPEVQDEPVTKPGDLWLLGSHRLLCGDSTNVQHVERLMGGEKADMVFTDPPYGIAYDNAERWAGTKKQSPGAKINRGAMILGDETDFDPSFILAMFDYCKEIFIWGMQYYPDKLRRGGAIVWNRKTKEQEECPFADFELCWSKQERNRMAWIIWGGFISKEKGEERLHTTQKPIALAEWFFEQWGKGKNLVVDLFGGSGSTLIACEKTQRRCFMMELDPKYCQVIIERWCKYTGKMAYRLDEDGNQTSWEETKGGLA